MAVVRSEEAESFEIEPGIHVMVLTGAETGAAALNAGMATLDPGASLRCHTHDCEESVTILVGEAYLDLNGDRKKLEPFDTSVVKADVPHRYVNASDEKVMTMFWVYASSSAGRTIVDAELCGSDPAGDDPQDE